VEHKIFAIYDQKAFAYLPPFTLPRSEMAIRTFADCINSENHAFAKHPGDYTLVELGIYDDSDGAITLHQTRLTLGTGIEFKQEIQNDKSNSVSNDPPIQPGTNSGNTAQLLRP